jgi:hypothetical protein
MITLPPMAMIQQTFDPECIDDIHARVFQELERIGVRQKVMPGQEVAITAGSRGIANIAEVIRAVVDFVVSCGAAPFIFPAMGSHGGATAEGQASLLANLGITSSTMGCEIRSTMETDEIGRTPDGLAVFADRYARFADHMIVVNRIKPHTKFEGNIESGLMKMLAIGVGKHEGAKRCHKASVQLGMNRVIETVGSTALSNLPVVCGIGLVENGYDKLAIINAFGPNELSNREKELLVQARKKMARIPFADIDLLIIDEIGKNISGTGMDTNVTGVNRDILGTFTAKPRTRRLFVRDLAPETEGNALGIGLADFTTTRLVEKIDREKTYINCLTGISPEKGAIPMYFDTDRECIEAAIHCLGMETAEDLRIVYIRNTSSLGRLFVSKRYIEEIEGTGYLSILRDFSPMPFDKVGNIISPFSH